MKKRIYLNEYNIPTGNSIYLPYSSGLLQTFAQQYDFINQEYGFVKIFFQRDTVENIVKQYQDPNVVGFSVSKWNYQLSLAVARELKRKFPTCLTVFGGPSITKDKSFFDKYPFVDLCVYREGEQVFANILEAYPRIKKHTIFYDESPSNNVDRFPSPYVAGIFDSIIEENPSLEFKAIIETNRNCPFNCAFCYWGSNELTNKIRFHGIDYIQKDFEWIAQHKIKYVFCADANFGMYKRDTEIAQICNQIKTQYSYPEKFRVCYGKNSTQNIFNAAAELSKAHLAKTVTLSVQSFNPESLKAVGRKNIRVENFKQLESQYSKVGIPTYTELILGLPSETKESFIKGLEQAIRLVGENQIFIYHCEVLPNTLLADKDYQEKYGIKTIQIPLSEVHVTARKNNFIQEFDQIIIKTNSMTTPEWIECTVLSWLVQLCHSLKVANLIVDYIVSQYNINYMDIYTWLLYDIDIQEVVDLWLHAESILELKTRCLVDGKFGNIYYEPEEMYYLRIMCDKDNFYDALCNSFSNFLTSKGLDNNPDLSEIFKVQLETSPNVEDFDSLENFATQVILHGRKSNKIVVNSIS